MKLIFINLLITIFFNSCGFNTPEKFGFNDVRKFSNDSVSSKIIFKKDDFRDYFSQTPYLSLISDKKLGNDLFHYSSGDVNRFFIKKDKYELFYWEKPEIKPKHIKIDNSYPMGLIIGQTKQNIYFYNSISKGNSFCTTSLSDNKSFVTYLTNLIVININPIANNFNELLICGILKQQNKNILGFYKIDAFGNLKSIETQINLDFEPDGDPGVFGGTFYQIGNKTFYLFNNRSGIFVFTQEGKFLKEIETIDTFSFKHISNSNYSMKFEGLYKDLYFKSDQIYIRTNIVNTKNKYIVFDKYSLNAGKYLNSTKLFLKDIDLTKFSYPIWSFTDDNGSYHILLSTQYTSGQYSEIEFDL